MKKTLQKILFILLVAFSLTACKKDDPVHEHENELINTVKIQFVLDEDVQTFEWKDGTPEKITLLADNVYKVNISFFNIDHHEEDITHEIEEDGVNHQIFLSSTPADLFDVTYTDKDENDKPIGLASDFKTKSSAASGTLRVLLKHYSGDKNGSPSSGSTDIDVQFPIEIL